MNKLLYRFLLLVCCVLLSYWAAPHLLDLPEAPYVGAASGTLLFVLILVVERVINTSVPLALLGGSIGVAAAVLLMLMLRFALGLGSWPVTASLALLLACGHLGFTAGARTVKGWRPGLTKEALGSSIAPKVLDTSAIIDGRIVDMVELGFIAGPLVVPQFVLNELQGIADSSDPLRRARGRRGLGILERMQSVEGAEVRIVDEDYPNIKEVDGKIAAMAKAKNATLVTTDFNLSKVAELQGIRVLNVHQLSQALRPVVLPGEHVRVTVQKHGKEQGQGVGYLDDGTMVVVENGGNRLHEALETIVTSVLQTSAGRMIFSRLPDEPATGEVKERRGVWRRRG